MVSGIPRITAIELDRQPTMIIGNARAINSAARVPPLQGGGQGFESLIAHFTQAYAPSPRPKRIIHDLLGLVHNRLQMPLIPKALRVNLVNVFRP